jgi:hypothetical protein
MVIYDANMMMQNAHITMMKTEYFILGLWD